MLEIDIKKPIFDGKVLQGKFSVPDELQKYLKRNELVVEYDEPVTSEDSILNIPTIAAILPLAWLTGSNIIVGKIDKRFKESMDNLKTVFKKIYPLAPFTTEIHAEKQIENKINLENPDRDTGLLFSGGVDSAFSMINNMIQNPRLVMLWGIDDFPYPKRTDHWEKTVQIYAEYSKRKNLEFNVVKTNMSQILDDRRISHKYHKELFDGRTRSALTHSMVLLPLVAPLSIGRFKKLIIAASYTEDYDFNLRPRAAIPSADEKIVWADLDVKHDGFVPRFDKIMAIQDQLKDDLILRVCVRSTLVGGNINDSTCEKCLRTIGLLILAGIDPNKCGFSVDESTFKGMRYFWENRKTALFGGGWREIQRLIPDNIEYDFHGSRDFFEWFSTFNFKNSEKNWFYTDLYMNSPYFLAKKVDSVYRKVGIDVHENPYNRIRGDDSENERTSG